MKTIKIANEGYEVLYLKEQLARLNYPVTENSLFDETTQEAVIAFQKEKGLTADGIVGFHTWEQLLFTGRNNNQKLTEEDFKLVAHLLDIETACIKAV